VSARPALTIWVDARYLSRPEVQALVAQGHKVSPVVDAPDLILHPAAHAWNDMHWPYLEQALVQARKRKKVSLV